MQGLWPNVWRPGMQSQVMAARNAHGERTTRGECCSLNGPSLLPAVATGALQVRGHLTAARLLTKHGLATPVRMVRDANRAAAEGLVRTLLARVSRAKNSESRWVEVWMDLRTVQERGLQALPEAALRAELCAALLRCGQFRLAGSYLQGLEAGKADRLVVAAARDYFLSATSLSDKAVRQVGVGGWQAGNGSVLQCHRTAAPRIQQSGVLPAWMGADQSSSQSSPAPAWQVVMHTAAASPALLQAQECLAVLPDSAAARKELAEVQTALKLQVLGIELAPLQLHQLRQQGPQGSARLLEQASVARAWGHTCPAGTGPQPCWCWVRHQFTPPKERPSSLCIR